MLKVICSFLFLSILFSSKAQNENSLISDYGAQYFLKEIFWNPVFLDSSYATCNENDSLADYFFYQPELDTKDPIIFELPENAEGLVSLENITYYTNADITQIEDGQLIYQKGRREFLYVIEDGHLAALFILKKKNHRLISYINYTNITGDKIKWPTTTTYGRSGEITSRDIHILTMTGWRSIAIKNY